MSEHTCEHAEPQADSQLHGVCIFCYRDRLGAARAEIERQASKIRQLEDGEEQSIKVIRAARVALGLPPIGGDEELTTAAKRVRTENERLRAKLAEALLLLTTVNTEITLQGCGLATQSEKWLAARDAALDAALDAAKGESGLHADLKEALELLSHAELQAPTCVDWGDRVDGLLARYETKGHAEAPDSARKTDL